MTRRRSPARKRLDGLRQNLRYFQMMTRMDWRSYQASKAKCKEIGAAMTKLLKEEKWTNSLKEASKTLPDSMWMINDWKEEQCKKKE